MKKIHLISMAVAVTIAMGLSGCGQLTNAKNIPLVSELSQQELVDYYKKAMEYDTITDRSAEVVEETFQMREVSANIKSELAKKVKVIEEKLADRGFTGDSELSKYNYEYILNFIDNLQLSNSTITASTQALGFYFVDVEYGAKINSGEAIKNGNSSLLGIHGSLFKNHLDVDTIDIQYLVGAKQTILTYIKENKPADYEKLQALANVIGGYIGDGVVQPPVVDSEPAIDSETPVNSDGNTADTTDTEGTSEPEPVIEDTPEIVPPTFTESSIAQTLDIFTINKLAGSSTKQLAYMPEVEFVAEKASNSGIMAGYGLYKSGKGGLTAAGFKQSNLEGTVVLRYVFKGDIKEESKINFKNVYPISMTLNTGIEKQAEPLIPDFVKTELDKVIERSDRAIMNDDTAALSSNTIYSGNNIAMLIGMKNNNSNLMRNISSIRRVVSRDIINNTYLVEVESTVYEGPKQSDTFGAYRDTTLYSIQQTGTDFLITDMLKTNRTMTKEPKPNLDNSITKRLVALNLSGEVKDEAKTGVNAMLKELYTAGNNRSLKDIDKCFNSDAQLLSTARNNYLQSQLRSWLTKGGADKKSTMQGVVTEWVGGATNQVEFMTEELVDYEAIDKSQYVQLYYLVSNMKDKWVIDEIKVVEIRDVEKAEAKQIRERVASPEIK